MVSSLSSSALESFALEKSTRKISIMLSARELRIEWGGTPKYWKWISLPDSRFSEVAELVRVCWLDIKGRTSTELLSPKTTYVAYLIFKLTPKHYGFEDPSQETYMTVGTRSSTEVVFLSYHDQSAKNIPQRRVDGWMEIVLGEFFNGDEVEGEVEVGLREIKEQLWKGGLIVGGIELRPKNQSRSSFGCRC